MPALPVQKKTYTLAEKAEETPSYLFLRFRPNETSIPFIPGMFMMLRGIDPVTQKLYGPKAFSIASGPAEPTMDIIAIKEPHGRVSHFVDAKEGDQFEVNGPRSSKNDFFLYPLPGKALFVSGGSGVAPLFSGLANLASIGELEADVALLWSVRNIKDLIRKDELAKLREKLRRLSVNVTVTRPTSEDRPDNLGIWEGETGRISAAMMARHVPDIAERTAFVCGSNDFAATVTAALLECKVSPQRIKPDNWG